MFHYIDKQLVITCPNTLVSHLIEDFKSEFKQELQSAKEQWFTLILDLTEVQKLDVHGMHFIMDLHYDMIKKNKEFMLIGCNELVLESIKLYRLDKLRAIGINKTSAQLAAEKLHHDSLGQLDADHSKTISHMLTREARLEQFKKTHQ